MQKPTSVIEQTSGVYTAAKLTASSCLLIQRKMQLRLITVKPWHMRQRDNTPYEAHYLI